MYREFYKLRRDPFDITPDPSFLFLSKRHREALASMYHGIRRRRGFVVLTGEVGTGKTLLITCLLQLLRDSEVRSAFVFNSRLCAMEFLQYIAAELGLSVRGKSKAEVLHELSRLVITRHEQKLTTLIIIDEAHYLPPDSLEEVRLLSNLETAQDKLVQILLVGQPELSNRLDSFEFRHLKQRVALRSNLGPLNLDETRSYVRRRLLLAGADKNTDELVPQDTIVQIHHHARGIPRLINTICENAFITAFARRLPQVSPDIIDEVAEDLCLGVNGSPQLEGSAGSSELLQAARTLLEMHDRLHRPRRVEELFTELDLELGDDAPPRILLDISNEEKLAS